MNMHTIFLKREAAGTQVLKPSCSYFMAMSFCIVCTSSQGWLELVRGLAVSPGVPNEKVQGHGQCIRCVAAGRVKGRLWVRKPS